MKAGALALAFGVAAGCAGQPAQESYVLVHGSWMGAWAWDDVAAGLRAKGATVTVVELPAHGADRTPIAGATMDAYVATVDAVLAASSEPVVLVGHSMGGVVITQEAENRPDKISRLIYLAAYLPQNGQSLFTLASTDAGSHLVADLMVDQTAGTADIAGDRLADDFCADCSPAALARLQQNYRTEPLAPLLTPVVATAAHWGSVPKSYVYTTQDHAVSYALQQQMVATAAVSDTRSLDTGHAPFLSAPATVVTALRALATGAQP